MLTILLRLYINTWYHTAEKKAPILPNTLIRLKETFQTFIFDILGLKHEEDGNSALMQNVMELVIELRKDARIRKDFAASDKIRDTLKEIGILL